jgi:O-antigen ligase
MIKKAELFNKEKIQGFYSGNLYPAIIAALVLFGAVSGFEVITMLIHTVILYGVFLFSDSVKPLLISLLTFVYQISREHAPQYPTRSDYYTTSWRIWVLVAVGVGIFVGLVIFSLRNKVFSFSKIKKTPLLLPSAVFSAGLLLNGLFSGEWVFNNLIFAFANAVIYLVLYVFIYNGFKKEEKTHELVSYFSYLALLSALIISIELIHMMLTNENLLLDGSINKGEMALGWGIWNLVAVSLAILIPLLFYGFYVNKYPWLYFAAATLAYVMSVLTMSRNALVFSTLSYGACIIISCFVGKNKRVFRVITLVGILGVITLGVLLWDKIYTVLGDYFERGFSDNGRFDIWRGSFSSFLDAPIFGSGFYGLNIYYEQFGFLPHMAHNTLFELLGALGIFGTLAYAYYRVKTLLPVIRRPSLMKSMLFLSILTLLLESLLDNFILNFYPVFYYVLALALINRSQDGEKL